VDKNLTSANENVLQQLDALLNRDKVNAVADNEIPLLTEIYQPEPTQIAQAKLEDANLILSPEHIEQLVELLLPEMNRIMQEALTQHVQPALETTLRQRLQALAQQKLNL
jgi:hypothetical protein